jgi:hypothetical protein
MEQVICGERSRNGVVEMNQSVIDLGIDGRRRYGDNLRGTFCQEVWERRTGKRRVAEEGHGG